MGMPLAIITGARPLSGCNSRSSGDQTRDLPADTVLAPVAAVHSSYVATRKVVFHDQRHITEQAQRSCLSLCARINQRLHTQTMHIVQKRKPVGAHVKASLSSQHERSSILSPLYSQTADDM